MTADGGGQPPKSRRQLLKERRKPRWYFGGLASAGAALCTHPLDLLKVQLQTQQDNKLRLIPLARQLVQREGFMALYNGISASMLRQLTYSTVRFALYDIAKRHVPSDTVEKKFMIAVVAGGGGGGGGGGFAGTPADMVNVRMQNDVKLPHDQRRNYKHAIDGLVRVFREEGVAHIVSGWQPAVIRASCMTVGQLVFYDQAKITALSHNLPDDFSTHFLCSLAAGIGSVICTQPVDVIKTRTMQSGTMGEAFWNTVALGPKGFFKGVVPSSARILPFNILVFVFYEWLRQNLGFLPAGEEID